LSLLWTKHAQGNAHRIGFQELLWKQRTWDISTTSPLQNPYSRICNLSFFYKSLIFQVGYLCQISNFNGLQKNENMGSNSSPNWMIHIERHLSFHFPPSYNFWIFKCRLNLNHVKYPKNLSSLHILPNVYEDLLKSM